MTDPITLTGSHTKSLTGPWFRNRSEAKVVIEDWRREYNEVRPHSSLGKLTPTEFARSTSKILGTANF